MGTSNWAKQHFKFELLSWIWDLFSLVHRIVYVTVLSDKLKHKNCLLCISVNQGSSRQQQVAYTWLCDHHIFHYTSCKSKTTQPHVSVCKLRWQIPAVTMLTWDQKQCWEGGGGRVFSCSRMSRKQKRTWAVNVSEGGFFPCDFNGLTFVLGWGTALHSSVRVCCDWVAPCGGPEVILSGALIWSASIVPPWSSHGLQRHVVGPDTGNVSQLKWRSKLVKEWKFLHRLLI